VEEERERNKSAQDEQDVEAHKVKPLMDEDDASDPERRANDDESDVEAHRFKA
jgi:hypothetical protein